MGLSGIRKKKRLHGLSNHLIEILFGDMGWINKRNFDRADLRMIDHKYDLNGRDQRKKLVR